MCWLRAANRALARCPPKTTLVALVSGVWWIEGAMGPEDDFRWIGSEGVVDRGG